jgi:hypothetical protein
MDKRRIWQAQSGREGPMLMMDEEMDPKYGVDRWEIR